MYETSVLRFVCKSTSMDIRSLFVEFTNSDYVLRNDSSVPITAEAVYTVTPFWLSKYFAKLECFCFKR
ncbi:MAG: cytochrome c oxidase assembly protein, partial [Candidatus Hodgkinia cicadicola]